ncbi:hypothetical protein KO506_02440 [Polaribacter vadi]|uniref:hypothetical protein n=1 Tax=Polaribacter TaxID=52959 RepID=UPI001C0932FB|nr:MULTISPECIES: hypothetical protein [Polaribacter]MBU3010251.1 hypothetical protein [Polaribacter vadi]MDO6740057.1 hypothetical protein [Polaribacter sp. 1_MG-2023]
MKKLLFSISLICLTLSLSAQSIGNLKTTNKKWAFKTMKKASKRIYINSFNVNFEVYKEAIDFKAGGNGGRIGGNNSSATAKAAVGLSGIDGKLMQEKTNLLYKNYMKKLEDGGYEIITTEEVAKVDAIKDWDKTTGPNLIENLTGIITCVPENYTFYHKKKGLLGLGWNIQPKLAKQLGNVIVADVNLYVIFSESGNDWMKGRAAKVKIKTNLRLAGEYAITIPQKFKEKKSTLGKLFGSVKIKGASDVHRVNSNIAFYDQVQANYTGSLKEDLEINDIVKKQKIVAYQKQGSFVPTSFTTFSNYLDAKADRYSTTTKWIEVDGDKYAQGFYNACNAFLENQLDEILPKLK